MCLLLILARLNLKGVLFLYRNSLKPLVSLFKTKLYIEGNFVVKLKQKESLFKQLFANFIIVFEQSSFELNSLFLIEIITDDENQ